MTINNRVSNLINNLAESGLVSNLIDLHTAERTRRIVSFTSSLIKLCRVLSIATGIGVMILNISYLLATIIYWIVIQVAIVAIDYIVNTLIIKGIFRRKPRIDFIVVENAEKTLQTTYKTYSEANVPMIVLLRFLMQTVPVFEKEPFYIAINYLGIKAIYRFDGSLLPQDVYEHLLNGEEDLSLTVCDDDDDSFICN